MDPTIDFFSAWSLMAILLTIDDMVDEIVEGREKVWGVWVVVRRGG
jgi:hypothetical protein